MFNFAELNWLSYPMGVILNILTFKYEEPIQITLFNWISLGNLNINFGILLDPLSMVVMVPIGVVTSAVLFYSLDYMRFDPARNRFYVVLSVFALFMTLLIVSDNYVTMFIGWELIGVISYLLISFWNTRISAMKSALSAILLNRMGDALFVIFLGTIISLYNSVEFNTIELLTPHTHTTTLNLLAIMLLVAATAKSAQLGLHSWLLLAMESPTPVSSLLHAATMVCSGVFVLVRSSYILEYTPSILLVILWLGGITTLVSGLIAVVSNDIKRVIALSTMSQLAQRIYFFIKLSLLGYLYLNYNKFINQTICEKLYLLFNKYTPLFHVFLSIINKYIQWCLSFILKEINKYIINGILLYISTIKFINYVYSKILIYINNLAMSGYHDGGNYNNSQITKAHKYLYTYINYVFITSFYAKHQYLYLILLIFIFNIIGFADCIQAKKPNTNIESGKWKIIIISKLVGISETIRLIFIYIYLSLSPPTRLAVTGTTLRVNIPGVAGDIKITYILKVITSTFCLFIKRQCTLIKINYKKILLALDLQSWLKENISIKTNVNTSNYHRNQFIGFYGLKNKYNTNYRSNLNSIYTKSQIRLFHSISTLKNVTPPEIKSVLGPEDRIQMAKPVVLNENLLNKDIAFNQWLSGVIDGDGYFNLSKKGTARLNITMDARDLSALYDIKHVFGGSIYSLSGANAFKYQLSHRKGLIYLINSINGEIRNPKRLLQMNKLCIKYNIELIMPKPLTYNNGWLSGFLDADGSIFLSEKSGQIFISISQKNKYLLDPLIKIYSGRVYISSPKTEAFKYQIYRKNDLFNLIDNYFINYPLRTLKLNRLNLIKQFYDLRTYKNNLNDLKKLNDWVDFKDKWDKYLK